MTHSRSPQAVLFPLKSHTMPPRLASLILSLLAVLPMTGTTLIPDATHILLTPHTTGQPFTYSDPLLALQAVNAAPPGPVTLYVEPSVYWIDDPDSPVTRLPEPGYGSTPFAFVITRDTLAIRGLATDPRDVVFAVNRGQTQGALGNFTMFRFEGHSLEVENITFGNYCNVDLVYPRDPTLNRPRRRDAIVQAQIGICDRTDRLFARNCRFISRLNLCPFVGARRSLYKDCYFECTDDALSGSAIYLDCAFTFHSGKPFYSTASTGAIFLNCDIHTLVNGTQYLTKMPGAVTMIDTRFTSAHPVTLQWTRDVSSTRCYQSNVTLNGQPVTIDRDRPALSADITGTPLLCAYKVDIDGHTIYNIPNLIGTPDGWDPLGIAPTIAEASRRLATPLTGLPVAMRLTPSSQTLAPQADTTTLTPSTRLWADYPAPGTPSCTWSAPTTLTLSKAGETTIAVSANTFPNEMTAEVSATTPEGLVGATTITLAPHLREAPTLSSTPVLTSHKNSLRLTYSLSGQGTDNSEIIWYRATAPDLSDTVAVRHGRGTAAALYPLTPGDTGHYIAARITPAYSDSHAGHPVIATFGSRIVKASPRRESHLNTSFAEIPVRSTSPGRPGFWHFDTFKPADTSLHDWTPEEGKSWYYGQGLDAATGIGLIQATRGARLSYTPVRDTCRDMLLSLTAEPSKGPGQGFGSATGQYMDICIGFNPVTLTGYALRIERTPDHDKAVTFTLVRYDSGTVTPICDPVASNCFRTPCRIELSLSKGILTASASTQAPAVTPSAPGILPSVTLNAPAATPAGTSLAIQHTGSTGASATLIRDLDVIWK